jgi:energy-coupling factor transporter ATP-binding protein EcfA2
VRASLSRSPLHELSRQPRREPTDPRDIKFFGELRKVISFPLMSPTAIPSVALDWPQTEETLLRDLSVDTTKREPWLDTELTRYFFEELWVPRPEVHRVVEALAERHTMIALTGDRGSGKSTLIHYLFASLSATRTNFVKTALPNRAGILVDALQLRHLLRIKRASGRFDLCTTLYESLSRQVLATPESLVRWDAFLVASDPHFERVARRVRSAGQGLATAEVLARFTDELEADRVLFDEADGIDKLVAILQFIRRERGHDLMMFIDNVDRYTREFQVNVAYHLNELVSSGTLIGGIVTLRPENFRYVRQHQAGEYFSEQIELNPLDSLESVPPDDSDLSAKDSFFFDFFSKRLAFLEARLRLIPDIDPERAAADIAHYRAMIVDIRRFAKTVHIFGQLTKWYNGSARATAISFVSLLRREILSRPSGGAGAKPSWERVAYDERYTRSAIYRHIIIDDDDIVRTPSAPMLYSAGYPTCATAEDVPFLELHLLHLLSRSAMAVDEIQQHAANLFRAPASRVSEALKVLWDGRGMDDTGLVYIDQPVEVMPSLPRIRAQAEVRVLPAGKLMMQTLASSCEYLFWSALQHESGWRFLPPDVSVEEVVQTEPHILWVAIAFFHDWIAPRLELYREHLRRQEPVRFGAYARAYSEVAFEGAIRARVGRFLDTSSHLSRAEAAELAAKLGRRRSGPREARGQR